MAVAVLSLEEVDARTGPDTFLNPGGARNIPASRG
jgi:hypothetical protein